MYHEYESVYEYGSNAFELMRPPVGIFQQMSTSDSTF